jgi:DNA-binding NtrC family response regulator
MSTTSPPWVLVVDDQDDVRLALRLLLKAEGFACSAAGSPEEALALAAKRDYAVALVDMNYRKDTTSGEEGLALLRAFVQACPEMPIVAMTAWGSTPLVVSALRSGAADFVEKPWDNQRLLSVLRNQVALGVSRRREGAWRSVNAPKATHDDLRAESPAMRSLLDTLQRVAPTDANVLLLGENGTGKTRLAAMLHEHSPRAQRPFVRVNMGAIPEALFEAEMFGHVRGAFTDARSDRAGRFEVADGGTLFLDEVGNIPLSQQPKLLHVLESGEFERVGSSQRRHADVRLVSATNADLEQAILDGQFRRDLLYRLNTLVLTVPPLRERREDIVPMARAFLATAAQRYGRDPPALTPEAERLLQQHSWPGNVRELEHAMARAVLVGDGGKIGVEALGLGPAKPLPKAPTPGTEVANALEALAGHSLEDIEALVVAHVLHRTEGNIQRAAEMLGITRQALYRRLGKEAKKS